MFYRFILTILVIFSFTFYSYAYGNKTNIPKAPNSTQAESLPNMLEGDDDEDEFAGFIDRGQASLPVAPEVIQSMADSEVPENIISKPSKKELAQAPKKEESEEDKLFKQGLADLFSEEIPQPESVEDLDLPQKLATSLAEQGIEGEIIEEDGKLDLSIANKPDDIADIKNAIEKSLADAGGDSKISQNKDGSIHIETPSQNLAQTKASPLKKKEADKKIIAKKPEAKPAPTNLPSENAPQVIPDLPSLAPTIATPNLQKVEPAKKKKVIQIKKKVKEDFKLKRFVRDESIFILFKDDDIILGKLTPKGKFDQMSGLELIKAYEEQKHFLAGQRDAERMDRFIESRSYIENPHLPDKYLTKAVRQEIITSNLSDLRALDDNYEVIDLADIDGNTALHIASYENNAAITKWLIMRGAKLHPMNIDEVTPLEIAGFKGNWQIFDMLEKASEI